VDDGHVRRGRVQESQTGELNTPNNAGLDSRPGVCQVLSIVPISQHHQLSRRERQIIDALYKLGRASAADIRAELPAAPSYSAVRSLLRILEEKGHIRHEQDGPRYLYAPVVARDNAKRSAMRHLLQTFFDGSTSQAMSALLDVSSSRLDDAELDRLKKLIDQARKQGA
jgi:BlaI family transcriptional regulator, penicillinase repressor